MQKKNNDTTINSIFKVTYIEKNKNLFKNILLWTYNYVWLDIRKGLLTTYRLNYKNIISKIYLRIIFYNINIYSKSFMSYMYLDNKQVNKKESHPDHNRIITV